MLNAMMVDERVADIQEGPRLTTFVRGGLILSFVHEEEFRKIYDDVFVNQVYRCDTLDSKPQILDLGANIGLATIYFLQKNPKAHVTAFEPNPSTFRILEQNIRQNGLQNRVTLVNAAIGATAGTMTFCRLRDPADYHWGDFVYRPGNNPSWYKEEEAARWEKIRVPVRALGTYTRKPVAFMKVDIEGFEDDILRHTALTVVRQTVIEYHGKFDGDGITDLKLDAFLEMIKDAGFYLMLRQANELLMRRSDVRGKPNQPYTLLVYCHRSLVRLGWQLRADVRYRVLRKLRLA